MRFFLAICLFVGVFSRSLFSEEDSKIRLVWQADRKGSWEEDWILELLSGLGLEVIDDGKFQKHLDRSIVVVNASPNEFAMLRYFYRLRKMHYRFGIILLSDEGYTSHTAFYPCAQFVFRNYWHEKFLKQKNVLIFPLGYKREFWKNASKEIGDIWHREYTWSFAGQIVDKPTRREMIHQMKTIPNYFVYETESFASPAALKVAEYRDMMLQSIFIPCPRGWSNVDSFRVYEALECGCIPIVEKSSPDYFTQFFGQHPFLAVSSWREAPALIADLMQDPVLLEARRQQCYTWWVEYKKKMNEQFINLIEETLR